MARSCGRRLVEAVEDLVELRDLVGRALDGFGDGMGADLGLPAAAVAAVARAPVRVEAQVADLAGVAAGSLEPVPSGDDSGADTDVAGDVDQVVDADARRRGCARRERRGRRRWRGTPERRVPGRRARCRRRRRRATRGWARAGSRPSLRRTRPGTLIPMPTRGAVAGAPSTTVRIRAATDAPTCQASPWLCTEPGRAAGPGRPARSGPRRRGPRPGRPR